MMLSVFPDVPIFSERGANVSFFRVGGVVYRDGRDIDLDQYIKDYTGVSNIHENYALLYSFDLSREEFLTDSFVTYPEFETICVETVPKSGRIFFDNSIHPDYLFFTSGVRNESLINRYNINTGENFVVPATGYPLFMNDHMIVYGLVGYDYSGTEVWRFKRNEPSRSINYGAPILSFNDLIVFANEGVDGKPNSIIALNAESGTINWEYPLPFEIRRMNLDHGRICLATGNRMLALDPQSGKALADFKADIEDSQHTLFWYDGSHYYVIDAQGNRLQTYSPETLEKTSEWTFPIEFKPQLREPPKTIDGVNCMEMLNASLIDTSVYGGLLSWTPDDVRSGNPIEFDRPYPKVDVEVFKEDKKEAYRVKVHVQDIHDLLRYGEIEIKRIAANNGKQRWGLDVRNKKFNGHIELLVDPAIGEENAQYLDALMRRCEYFARLHDVTSGSGRQPIKPTWRFDQESVVSDQADRTNTVQCFEIGDRTIAYEEITDLKEIESILRHMARELDISEYDNEDDYHEAWDRLYPDEVRGAAKRASELGSIPGMHLYGRMLGDEARERKSLGKPYKDLQSKAKALVISAAKGGCWGAMDDLGTEYTEALSPSMAEQLAFIKLSGRDPLEHVAYCRDCLNMTITQEEIENGLVLFEELNRYMIDNNIEKTSCDCIFI